MPKGSTITIKELHARTGDAVRKAGQSRNPIGVTDHGKLVAILASPLHRSTPRRRTILPEYARLLARPSSGDVLEDLDAVRGDR